MSTFAEPGVQLQQHDVFQVSGDFPIGLRGTREVLACASKRAIEVHQDRLLKSRGYFLCLLELIGHMSSVIYSQPFEVAAGCR